MPKGISNPIACNFPNLICMTSFCIIPAVAEAQTRFDGFRTGIEVVYSETTLETDISAPRQQALDAANQRLTQGEAELSSASQRLSEERQRLDTAQSELLTYRSQLSQLEQSAAANPAFAAALAPEIASRRQAINGVELALSQRELELQYASASVQSGYSLLDAGRADYAAQSNTPSLSTLTLDGVTARFSLGWGTSFQTAIAPLHIGIEIDGAPGTGEGLLVVPGRYDTRIKGGAVFGASVKLGIVPIRWLMPYISAGVETQEFSILRRGDRETYQATGFRGGVGFEFSVTDNNIIRLGYERTILPDITFAGARIEPSRDAFKVGYIRRF
ncbi:hypothetical protein [Teichococcus vastitatis]|uniref:Outer membrane protein beta-barrel domain-containing protein n=1 Tax=Teichococcus vastitatis TaxID=2307076 RepID=A0ABS9W678_9PROT|nr:hypothetical protein [Pseudoroseomonas vastitatis]MCI0754742.1 hypothetical protein [Pseudoroseomonas vastitatis]